MKCSEFLRTSQRSWWDVFYKSLDQKSVHSIYLVYQHVIINSIKIGFQRQLGYNLYIYHFFGCLEKTLLNNKVAVTAFISKHLQIYHLCSSSYRFNRKCFSNGRFFQKQLQLNYLDKLLRLSEVTPTCPVATLFLPNCFVFNKVYLNKVGMSFQHVVKCNGCKKTFDIDINFSLSSFSCFERTFCHVLPYNW